MNQGHVLLIRLIRQEANRSAVMLAKDTFNLSHFQSIVLDVAPSFMFNQLEDNVVGVRYVPLKIFIFNFFL